MTLRDDSRFTQQDSVGLFHLFLKLSLWRLMLIQMRRYHYKNLLREEKKKVNIHWATIQFGNQCNEASEREYIPADVEAREAKSQRAIYTDP